MNGITFGSYHSYTDLSLILISKEIEAPDPKTETIDIPGGDGELDFTEFSGEVRYKNRKLTFVFYYTGAQSGFLTKFSDIQNKLHGKKLHITLDEDSDFYYVGRVSVDKWKADKNIGKITVEANCEPYKYKNAVTTKTVMFSASTPYAVSLTNLKKSVVPLISTDKPTTITWTGGSASISAGNDQIIPELVLREGTNSLTVTGSSSYYTRITFNYQEGEL